MTTTTLANSRDASEGSEVVVPGEQRGIRGRGRERRRCGGGMEQRRTTGGSGSCRDKHEANGSVQTPQAPASWQAGTDSASSPSF